MPDDFRGTGSEKEERCFPAPIYEGIDPWLRFSLYAATATTAVSAAAAAIFLLRGKPAQGPLIAALACTVALGAYVAYLRRETADGFSTCYVVEDRGIRRRRKWGGDVFVPWHEISNLRTMELGGRMFTLLEREDEHISYRSLRSGQRLLIEFLRGRRSEALGLLSALGSTPAASRFDSRTRALVDLCRDASGEDGEHDALLGKVYAAILAVDMAAARERTLELVRTADAHADDLLRASWVFASHKTRDLCSEALRAKPDNALARYYLAQTYSWPLGLPAALSGATWLQGGAKPSRKDLEAAADAWRPLVDDAQYGEEARAELALIDRLQHAGGASRGES